MMSKESGLYRVPHRDGTISFIGDSKNVKKNQPFAFRNSSIPITEDQLVAKLRESSLPIKGDFADILGWGGHSICIRVANGDTHYAVVIRSSKDPKDWNQLMNHWAGEQDINRDFAPYTISQNLVIVNGIDNQPAVMKITPEVPGAPISEVSGFYLFFNNELIDQHLDIMIKSLKRFISTGIIADNIGNISGSRLRSLLERYGLSLFNSSNLMVDFERNCLVIIDCESTDIRKQPPHRKLQLISRSFGMVVNIGILEFFKGLNKFRDKVFSNPTRKEEVDSVPGIDDLKEGFAEIISLFNGSGINYRVLGSFATAATINDAGGNYYLTPFRRNGTARDIDILVLDDHLNQAERLVVEFNSKRKDQPYYPQIALSLPKVFEKNQNYPENRPNVLPLIITGSAIDRIGNFYLIYRGRNKQIPIDYLKPVYQTYEGTEFPTVDAGILAGFYLTRMGIFKSKDIKKVTTLLDLTKAKIPVEFIDFSKVLRTNWPNLYRNFLIRELIYHFSGGLIRRDTLTHALPLYFKRMFEKHEFLDPNPTKN